VQQAVGRGYFGMLTAIDWT